MVIYPRGSARYKTGMSRLAKRYERETNAFLSMRHLADQAFSRAAGAPLVGGNSIRLLLDARENYPAWLDAIAAAQRYIHFELHHPEDESAGRSPVSSQERAKACTCGSSTIGWAALARLLARSGTTCAPAASKCVATILRNSIHRSAG